MLKKKTNRMDSRAESNLSKCIVCVFAALVVDVVIMFSLIGFFDSELAHSIAADCFLMMFGIILLGSSFLIFYSKKLTGQRNEINRK